MHSEHKTVGKGVADTMDLRQGLRLGLAMAKAAAHGVVCYIGLGQELAGARVGYLSQGGKGLGRARHGL